MMFQKDTGWRVGRLYGRRRHGENGMQDSKTYREYAEDCRRLARTMSDRDKATLLKMAEAWDGRADEVERREAKTRDGGGRDLTG